MSAVAIILPAAGASSRMKGRDKLLETVDGQPVLVLLVRRALATGADVIVAVTSPDHPRAKALAGLPVTLVPVPDAAAGMGHSLAAAAAVVSQDHEAVVILPADMPEITTDDLLRMIAAWQETPPMAILRGAAADGRPGHPVVIPRMHLPALTRLSGDQGAKRILSENPGMVRLVPLPDQHALVDLDTQTDWENWRNAQREA